MKKYGSHYKKKNGKTHYEENRQYYIDKAKKRQVELNEWYRDLKSNNNCIDCGIMYPHYVMQYDHLPDFEKEFSISKAIMGGYGKKRILTEMGKCELVCANCHFTRTYKRRLED